MKKSKNNNKPNIVYLIIKRIFDIIVSIIGLILTLPIYIIIKLCYMFTGDFSSIIYSHTRVGKNGKLFKLYKFRSMIKDADKKLEELLKNDKALAKEWKENHKLENDPRITKIGKFIRKSSLDECPQFINVFKGDMSLVGPRPPVVYHPYNGFDNYPEWAKPRFQMRPGMTGLVQISTRSKSSWDDRMKIDLEYIDKFNVLFDIKILFGTIKTVFDGLKA